jgi:hypothetical protein
MTAAPAPTDAKLTGNVLFYRQPEPLSLERHRNLGARRIQRPFEFLSGAHIVPITLNEFGVASSSYPIIFAGEAKTPLAVMGARAGENVFVNGGGEVDPEVYLPAFVRRYPFVFAAEPSGERLLVCIDRAAPMIGENPDIPLFNGDQPSQYTQEAIEFCKEFERHRRLTEELVGLLKQNDLFEPKSVTLTNRLFRRIRRAAEQPAGRALSGAAREGPARPDLCAPGFAAAVAEDHAAHAAPGRSQGAGAAEGQHAAGLSLWRNLDEQLAVVIAGEQALEGLGSDLQALFHMHLPLDLALQRPPGEGSRSFPPAREVIADDEALHLDAMHQDGGEIGGAARRAFIIVG